MMIVLATGRVAVRKFDCGTEIGIGMCGPPAWLWLALEQVSALLLGLPAMLAVFFFS